MAKYVKVHMVYEYPPAEAVLRIEDEDLDDALEGDGEIWDAVFSSSEFAGQVFDHAEEISEAEAKKGDYWG